MIASALIDFAGCMGLFVALGVLLNSFSSRAYRVVVADRFLTPKREDKLPPIKDLASDFISNTLFRYFGLSMLSKNAFLRSTTLSVGFFCILLVFFAIISEDSASNNVTSMDAYAMIFSSFLNLPVSFLLLSILFIIILDWASFLQTYYFMRYASRCSTFGEMVFIAYADIVLSINVFLVVFSVSIMALIWGAMFIPYHSITHYSFFDNSIARSGSERAHLSSLLEAKFDYLGRRAEYWRRVPVAVYDWQSKSSGLPDTTNANAATALFDGVSSLSYGGGVRYAGLGVDEITDFIVPILNTHGMTVAKLSDYRDSMGDQLPHSQQSFGFVTARHSRPKLRASFFDHVFDLEFHNTLYGIAFRAAQSVQLGFPEIMWKVHLLPIITEPEILGSFYSSATRLKDFYASIGSDSNENVFNDGSERISLFCDDRVTEAKSMEDFSAESILECRRRVVIQHFKMSDEIVAHAALSRSLFVPMGIFILASLCVTIIFYVAMFIFLAFSYIIRLSVLILPNFVGRFMARRVVINNSVCIIFLIGGSGVSVVLVALKYY